MAQYLLYYIVCFTNTQANTSDFLIHLIRFLFLSSRKAAHAMSGKKSLGEDEGNFAQVKNEGQENILSQAVSRKRRKEESPTARHSSDAEMPMLKEAYGTSKRLEKEKRRERRKEKAMARILKRSEKRKAKLSRKAILFEPPTSAKNVEQTLGQLPPLPDRQPFLHGHSALHLPNAATVRAMDDGPQYEYLKAVTTQCENILQLLHEVLLTTKKDRTETEVSHEDQLAADLIRLKNIPLARRYIEMTLWKRVARFNSDNLATVESLAYGASLPKNSHNHSNVSMFESDSTNFKFLSFRDKYLKNALDTYETDLEKMRLVERMDEDHVRFLRSCLQASADLYANVKCLDDNHGDIHQKVI